MPSKYKQLVLDNIGKTVHHWTIIRLLSKEESPSRAKWYALARCKCGVVKPVVSEKIFTNSSKSCGCAKNEALKTHGFTTSAKGGNSREYAIWNSMKQRCRNPKNKQYPEYGGRGISVCDSWLRFENFFRDMGERPFKGASLERKDNNKGYSPDNCKWADRNTQNNNKRNNRPITINGVTKNLCQWADHYGIGHTTIFHRIKAGWDVERAITQPARPIKRAA